MNLHLVGGFLGSGKTTAIIHAAQALMAQGLRVGVITNDQGKYLVDSAFFRLSDIPALEVTGGCFCCNYDDLNGRLAQLVTSAQPDVIFAESVGSCADIVATVVKPLLALRQEGIAPTSFSVFADIRLLRRRLFDQEMPFSEDVVYIFDKQIEEAGLLVVNKTDLLPAQELPSLQARLAERCPTKTCLFQSALSITGVQPWLDRIQTGGLVVAGPALEIDYGVYGAGEARLAWVDEEVELRFPPGQGRGLIQKILRRVLDEIEARGAGIGHLKFILRHGGSAVKLSFPTLAEPGDLDRVPEIEGQEAGLLINARVEIPALALRDIFREAFEAAGVGYVVRSEAAFHPPQPRPVHRIE